MSKFSVSIPKHVINSMTRASMEDTRPVPKELKIEIHSQVKALMAARFPCPEGRTESVNLYWTVATQRALMKRGYIALIQGGTALWPTVEKSNRGSGKTSHVAVKFSDEQATPAMERGEFPQIYTWCYIPGTNEIVDLSTGEFKEVVMHIRPATTWDSEQSDPPPYLWKKVSEDHPFYDYGYNSMPRACLLVEMAVNRMYACGDLDWLIEGIK